MKKPKSIMLPHAFFVSTYLLLWKLDEYYELDEHTAMLCAELTNMVEDKFEAMNRRVAFSEYKMAPPGSDEREELRAEYLGMTYIPKDWRSGSETRNAPDCDDDIPF